VSQARPSGRSAASAAPAAASGPPGGAVRPDWRDAPWETFERDLVVDGRRVHLVDVGAGPAVVFVHGLASSWQWWLETLPAVVARGHRAVALDLPGFGDSELPVRMTHESTARCIDEICGQLGLGDIALVGHSMGTVVAPEVAWRYPDRVAKLVLVGGPPLSVLRLFRTPVRTLRAHPETSSFLIEVATAGFPVSPFMRRQISERAWLRRLVFSPYVPRADLLAPDLIHRLLGGIGAKGMFPALRNGLGYEPEHALRGIGCPTLVVGGTEDKITPQRDLHEFAGMIGLDRLEIMEGTGHWPMLERPDAFVEVLGDFLDGTAGRTGA